jgi:hypothetical protein
VGESDGNGIHGVMGGRVEVLKGKEQCEPFWSLLGFLMRRQLDTYNLSPPLSLPSSSLSSSSSSPASSSPCSSQPPHIVSQS